MSLTAADVAEILRLLEQSSFDELNLEINGTKLSLKRGSAAPRNPGGLAGAPEAAAIAGSESGAGPSGVAAPLAGGRSGGGGGGGAHAAQPGAASANQTPAPSAANPSAAENAAPTRAATNAAPSRTTDPNLHDVASPLLGTFYRSPKPGAPPFVEVGATVTEDTIVAIIEVMKLMNTVRAGVRGTVTDIFPADGTLVEYDEPILRIRKSAAA